MTYLISNKCSLYMLIRVSFHLKHTAELKDIITALEAEGLGPEQCSSEEVVRVLFSRQKDFSIKLKEAEDILSSSKNGDPRPVIQVRLIFVKNFSNKRSSFILHLQLRFHFRLKGNLYILLKSE